MLNTLFNIPRDKKFIVACSGGVDSMAVIDFYRRGNKSFEIAYFNHGTQQANQMEKLVLDWAWKNHIAAHKGNISTTEKPNDKSPEEFWRDERYAWLCKIANGRPIITCHHLNDVAEGYLFSAINGNPKTILPKVNHNGNDVWRPFLTTTKQDMINWCQNKKVHWIEDSSNTNTHYPRNRIRHSMMNEVLAINPGFLKVIKKKVIASLVELK